MRNLITGLVLLLLWAALGSGVASSAGCGGGTCLRNSDCAVGFACESGHCAPKQNPSLEAGVSTAGATGSASTVAHAGTAGNASAGESGASAGSGGSDGALDAASQTPDAN